MKMYDLVGDIHGHAAELIQLLDQLGYRDEAGSYCHQDRTMVFVGDFVDRGPQIREVLEIVRPMVDSGAALAVMGNHEFNAIAFHTPHPEKTDKYIRPHSEKNIGQHAETVRQVTDLADYVEWFRALPMWLQLDGLRVVHACWDPVGMEVIDNELAQYGGVTQEFMA
ncbi:MAG: diadenosine tetraphosphatase, partial [Planctomycetaceae bacterium]|nr:diadenosine tetraphosphatase [Planctomycetaceae bacterium]